MIDCTARKIQMFSRNEDAGDVKKDKEGKKIDSSVETKKAEQEQD